MLGTACWALGVLFAPLQGHVGVAVPRVSVAVDRVAC